MPSKRQRSPRRMAGDHVHRMRLTPPVSCVASRIPAGPRRRWQGGARWRGWGTPPGIGCPGGGMCGDCRWRPSRGDGTLISLSDYLALGSIVALAVIHTGGMVPVVGDTHRDLPGALPTRAIISLEGNLINSTVTMLATLGAERNMAVWVDNGVRGRVTTTTRLIIVLTIALTATMGCTSDRLILRHVCHRQVDLATVWIGHADNLDVCKFLIRRPEQLWMRLRMRT